MGADVVEIGLGVVLGQDAERFGERQGTEVVETLLLPGGGHQLSRLERVGHGGQNLRWWLTSPTWSTNMVRLSNHHLPSTRWKVSR